MIEQRQERFSAWLLALTLGAVLLGPMLNLSQYWNHNPLYGYAWFVPALAVFLVYQRLGRLGPGQPMDEPLVDIAIFACVLCWIPLRVVQVANPDWRIVDQLYLGSAVLVCLLLLARLYGWHWARVLFFPLAFLLTTLPWPLRLENFVTLQSLQGVGETARVILGWFDLHVSVVGFEIRSPFGVAHLSEACSGIRSFHLAVVGGLFLGAFFNLSLPRRVVLFFACLLTAYLINVLRVVLLMRIIIERESVENMSALHDQLGWTMQIVFFVFMAVEALLLTYIRRKPRQEKPADALLGETFQMGAYGHGVLLGAILALTVTAPLFAEGWFRWREAQSVSLAQIENWELAPDLPRPGMQEEEMPLIVREQLPYKDGRYFTWTDPNGMLWQLIWMRFDGSTYSAFAHNIHQPETCLPSQNYTLQEKFAPVTLPIGGENFDWSYQLYARDGGALHLFFNKTAAAPAQLLSGDIDFSPAGRLKLAWEGVRIHEAQVLHLAAYAPYPPEDTREMARLYLQSFLEPATRAAP